MEAQNTLGRFVKERQYADLFEALLKIKSVNYRREACLDFKDSAVAIKGNRADFVVENKILVELKSLPFLTRKDYYQTMRYLKAANLKLGLLVNCRSEYLKPKRVLNSSHH